MHKGHLTLIGFILFMLGSLSLILSLVGLNLSIFSFMEKMPSVTGLLVKLFLIVGGMIIMYVSKMDRTP